MANNPDIEIGILVVIDETNCSRDEAIESLNLNNNDIVTSIMVIN
jgi:NACalpha-BTF3-like transcription factor